MDTPNGWRLVPLHRVADVRTGIAKNDKLLRDPVRLPYLRVANVQDGRIDLSEVKEIDVDRSIVGRYLIEPGDVLLTEGGDFDKLGRGAVWEGQVLRCLHQNHVFAVRADRTALEPQFLAALTQSAYGRRYFLSCSKQTTNLASINSTQLKRLPVLLPPPAEQRAIAALLSTWDRAIEQTNQLIEAKRQLKLAVLSDLSGTTDGYAGSAHVSRLGDVAHVNARSLPSTTSADYEFTYVDLSAVSRGRIEVPASSVRLGEAPSRARRMVQQGDVLLATVRPYLQGFALVDHPVSNWIASTGFAVVTPQEPSETHFIYQMLYSPSVLSQMNARLAGSNFPAMSGSDVEELRLPWPSDNVHRQQVGRLLMGIDGEIRRLHDLQAAYGRQKRALADKLLTGQIRLSVPEEP